MLKPSYEPYIFIGGERVSSSFSKISEKVKNRVPSVN